MRNPRSRIFLMSVVFVRAVISIFKIEVQRKLYALSYNPPSSSFLRPTCKLGWHFLLGFNVHERLFFLTRMFFWAKLLQNFGETKALSGPYRLHFGRLSAENPHLKFQKYVLFGHFRGISETFFSKQEFWPKLPKND